jgi:hypothetical protein
VFIFATAVFAPVINPILIIYELNKGLQSFGFSFISSYVFYMVTVLLAIGILLIANQLLVSHHINKENIT